MKTLPSLYNIVTFGFSPVKTDNNVPDVKSTNIVSQLNRFRASTMRN